MNEIRSLHPSVAKVLGTQSYSEDTVYRLLGFCMTIELSDGYLLYNGLTKGIMHLTADEYCELNVCPNLVEKWYLVPEDTDDVQFCDQLRIVLRSFSKKEQNIKGFVNYVIFTTTDCNARCFYCFEKGMAVKTMTEETAERVISYISDTRAKDKEVSLRWFGGEPLFNSKVINTICTGLKTRNIPYKSYVLSNCYLFDEEMIRKGLKEWNLKKVQVTIDGTEKIYNRTKSYIYKNVNAYKHVMNNIDLLLKKRVEVLIRLNVDGHNVNDMKSLIPDIDRRFKGRKGLHVYATAVYPPANNKFFSKKNEEKKGFLVLEVNRILEKYGYYSPKSHIGIIPRFCMSNSSTSIMISPEGYLGKCEHYGGSYFHGHVDRTEINADILNLFSKLAPPYEGCCTCVLYPGCSRLKMCIEGAYNHYGCDHSKRIVYSEEERLNCLNIYRRYKARRKAEDDGNRNTEGF